MNKTLVVSTDVEICQEKSIILQDVNFSFEAGELIYLVGRVGSGKSTLLQTLYHEIPISKGNADILGFSLDKMRMKDEPDLRKKLGIVFQDFKLLTDRSVHANLSFVLQAVGWKDWTAINERIEEVLKIVEMEGKADQFPKELSGGEQQRIAIARALLNSPSILLVDEPTGNLDFITGKYIFKLLQQIAKEGTLVIMATHNLHFVREFQGVVFQIKDKTLQNITAKVYVKDLKD